MFYMRIENLLLLYMTSSLFFMEEHRDLTMLSLKEYFLAMFREAYSFKPEFYILLCFIFIVMSLWCCYFFN